VLLEQCSPDHSPDEIDRRTEIAAANAVEYGLNEVLFLDVLVVYQCRLVVPSTVVAGRPTFVCVIPTSREETCLGRIKQILEAHFRLLEDRQVGSNIEITVELLQAE
jgi:hypothetical protein